MARFRTLVALLAGRWQVPVAVLALVAAVFAVQRLRPAVLDLDFPVFVGDIQSLLAAGAFRDAADSTANLLEMRPPLPPPQRAELHELLAEIVYRQESLRATPISDNVQLILTHQQKAIELGRVAGPAGQLRLARAHEWLGHVPEAISGYRKVLEQAVHADERRVCLQALVALLEGRSNAAAERHELIERLLAEQGVSPAYVWWGVQRAMQEAFDRGDLKHARDVYERYESQFKRSDLIGYHDYLHAWLLIHEGRYLEAQPIVDGIDQWLAGQFTTGTTMAQAGFLPVLNRVLRGRIHLVELRPQSALSAFDEALALEGPGDAYVSAVVGRSEALAMLERHEAAREGVLAAAAALRARGSGMAPALARLGRSMERLHEKRSEAGDYRNAVGYLQLAVDLAPRDELETLRKLSERLAEVAVLAATSTHDGDEAVRMRTLAGDHFERASTMVQFDVSREADLLWAAAEQYDLAGRIGDARRVLLRYVSLRSDDPRRPRAMLQLAQTYAADGMLSDALAQYEKIIREFPKLEEGARATLLRAQTLLTISAEGAAEAERSLLALLEGEIAPDAPVFRAALHSLGELLYEQGRFALAIRRLEDFLTLYPQDDERARILFLLANAYRQAAYELRDDPPADVPLSAALEESQRRFAHASELFGQLLAEITPATQPESTPAAPPAALDPQNALYERLALFYRGDCLYELNDNDSLREALATYRQAAARYQREPASLVAQVQIANIYLRMGRVTEAARAIENARWLLRAIPPAGFDESPSGQDAADWDGYLSALAGSRLFRDVFADAQ